MNRNASVRIAKDRIKNLIVSDRVNCTPDTFDKLQKDLFQVISKYIENVPRKPKIEITGSYIHISLTGEE